MNTGSSAVTDADDPEPLTARSDESDQGQGAKRVGRDWAIGIRAAANRSEHSSTIGRPVVPASRHEILGLDVLRHQAIARCVPWTGSAAYSGRAGEAKESLRRLILTVLSLITARSHSSHRALDLAVRQRGFLRLECSEILHRD